MAARRRSGYRIDVVDQGNDKTIMSWDIKRRAKTTPTRKKRKSPGASARTKSRASTRPKGRTKVARKKAKPTERSRAKDCPPGLAALKLETNWLN